MHEFVGENEVVESIPITERITGIQWYLRNVLCHERLLRFLKHVERYLQSKINATNLFVHELNFM